VTWRRLPPQPHATVTELQAAVAASFLLLRLPVVATVAKLRAHDGGDLGTPPRDGSGLVPIASGVDPASEPWLWRRSCGG
jgi:hypothetical protein